MEEEILQLVQNVHNKEPNGQFLQIVLFNLCVVREMIVLTLLPSTFQVYFVTKTITFD